MVVDREGMVKLNGKGGGEGGWRRRPGLPCEPGKVTSDFLIHEDVRDGTIGKEGSVAGGGEGGGASVRAMEKDVVG